MDLQEFIARWYESKGYDAEPVTLMLGLVEEVGELAQTLLLTQCSDFRPSKHKTSLIESGLDPTMEDVPREIGDVLIYLIALCNKLGVRPYLKCITSEVRILVQSTEGET